MSLFSHSRRPLRLSHVSAPLPYPRRGKGFPGDSAVKEFAYNAGHPGLIPGLQRSAGEGNGKYSCLENLLDRGASQATGHRIMKNQTQLK